MKSFLSTTLQRTLLLLSGILFVLAFLPLLFPYVLAAGTLLSLLSLGLYLYTRQNLEERVILKEVVFHQSVEDTVPTVGKRTRFTSVEESREGLSASRAKKSLRISVKAILLNGVAYALLITHSYACYIHPLSDDLEPIRETFRKETRQVDESNDTTAPASPRP